LAEAGRQLIAFARRALRLAAVVAASLFIAGAAAAATA